MSESLTIADLLKPQPTTHHRRLSIQHSAVDYSSLSSQRDARGGNDSESLFSPRQSFSVKKSFQTPDQPHETGAASPYSEKGDSLGFDAMKDQNGDDSSIDFRFNEALQDPTTICLDTSSKKDTPKEERNFETNPYQIDSKPLRRQVTTRETSNKPTAASNDEQIVDQESLNFPHLRNSTSNLSTVWDGKPQSDWKPKEIRSLKLNAFKSSKNLSSETNGTAGKSVETFGESRRSHTRSSQSFNPDKIEILDNLSEFFQIIGITDSNKYFRVGDKTYCISQKLASQISDFKEISKKGFSFKEGQKEDNASEIEDKSREREGNLVDIGRKSTILSTISEENKQSDELASQSTFKRHKKTQKSQFHQKSSPSYQNSMDTSPKSKKYPYQTNLDQQYEQESFSTRSNQVVKKNSNSQILSEKFSPSVGKLLSMKDLDKVQTKEPLFSGTTISCVNSEFLDGNTLYFQKNRKYSNSLHSIDSSQSFSSSNKSAKDTETQLRKVQTEGVEKKKAQNTLQPQIANLKAQITLQKENCMVQDSDTPSFIKDRAKQEQQQFSLNLEKTIAHSPKSPKLQINTIKEDLKECQISKTFTKDAGEIRTKDEKSVQSASFVVPVPGFGKKKKNPFAKRIDVSQQQDKMDTDLSKQNDYKAVEPAIIDKIQEMSKIVAPLSVPGFGKKKKNPFAKRIEAQIIEKSEPQHSNPIELNEIKVEIKKGEPELAKLPVPGFGKKKRNPFTKQQPKPLSVQKSEQMESVTNQKSPLKDSKTDQTLNKETKQEKSTDQPSIIPKILKLPRGRKMNPFRRTSNSLDNIAKKAQPDQLNPQVNKSQFSKTLPSAVPNKLNKLTSDKVNIKIKKCVSFDIDEKVSLGSSAKTPNENQDQKSCSKESVQESQKIKSLVDQFMYKQAKTMKKSDQRELIKKKSSTKELCRELQEDTNQFKQIERQLLTMHRDKSDMKAKREMFKTMSYNKRNQSEESSSASFQSSSYDSSPNSQQLSQFSKSPTKVKKKTFTANYTLQVQKTMHLDKISEMNEKYEGFSESEISDFSREDSTKRDKTQDQDDPKKLPRYPHLDQMSQFTQSQESPKKLPRTDTILSESSSLKELVTEPDEQNLVNYVGNLAKGFGLDPELFLDEEIMTQSPDKKLQKGNFTVSHKVKQEQKKDRDVREVIKVLKSQQSQKQIRTYSTMMKNTQTLQHLNSNQILINSQNSLTSPETIRKLESYDNQIPEGSESFVSSDLQTLQNVKYDITKHTLQLAILRKFVKQIQDKKEDDQFKFINEALYMIKNNQGRIDEIMKMIKNQESQLHFAFFFASPLVLSSQSGQESSYKLIPPLNYKAEFSKIKESIVNAQVQIRITKRQCTTTALNEILAEKPMVIHFSGHGLLNTKAEIGFELSEMYKGQGDLLLLETETGDSQLVSRDALKKMILKNECELQLVVVATCHSEFVGKIFQQAGAKHVVCIQQSYEVADEAIITFTETFYNMLFRQNKRVCDAYEMAVDQVNLVHGELQAKIFKLLKLEEQFHKIKTVGVQDEQASQQRRGSKQPHKCCNLNFQKGKMTEQYLYDSQLKNTAVAVPSLLGRQKDMFKLLQKIMVSMTSRLFQLTGLPGVGKSALVRNTLHFIEERSLLQGGSIYINSQDFEQTEQFARYFNQEVMNNNSVMFGRSLENEHDANKTLNLLLSKISMIEGTILLVIDNADELIQNDRISFINLLTQMLRRLPQLRIMITSRIHIDSEFTQDLMVLPSLSRIQACNLFKKLTRELTKQDIDGLMRLKPNFDRYPQEQAKFPYKKLHEHHFFNLLGGNPQSISLVAPLLTDPSQCLSLDGLYELLQSQQIYDILNKKDTPNQVLMSLKICAQISIQHFQENDQESMELFFLLGLLPGGISNFELDELWVEVQKAMKDIREEQRYSDHIDESFEEQLEFAKQDYSSALSQNQQNRNKSTWIRSYKQLLQGNLIEVKDVDKKGDYEVDNYSPQNHRNEQFIIQMPQFVQNFSEGLIPKETCEKLNQVLTAWFLKKMVSFYKFANLSADNQSDFSNVQENDKGHFLGRFQQNLNAFVEFMTIKYAKQAPMENQIDRHIDDTFNSDMDEEFIDDEHAFDSSSDSNSSDYSDHLSPIGTNKAVGAAVAVQLPELPKLLSKTKTMSLWKKQESIRLKKTLCHESEANFKAQLENVKHLSKSNNIKTVKSPIRLLHQDSGLEKQARCGIEALGGIEIEEEVDSDQVVSPPQLVEPDVDDYSPADQQPEIKSKSTTNVGFYRQFTSAQEQSQQAFKKIQRFSLARKPINSKKVEDLVPRKTTAQYFEQMNTEEMTMSYFVATLVIYEQFSPVLKLTEKYFKRMKETSSLFKGNIRRFEALSRLQLLEQETRKGQQQITSFKSMQSVDIEFDDLFVRAERNYKKKPSCLWGLGLTYLQEAQTHYFLLKKLKNQRIEDKKMKSFTSSSTQSLSKTSMSLRNQIKEFEYKIKFVKDRLNLAISNLERIQHFRALSCAYNLKAKLLEIQMLENQENVELIRSSTSTSSENGPPSNWIDLGLDDELAIQIKEAQTKRREYMRQTERALNNLIQKKREIFINRKQGEEFSIFVGIVHSRQVKFLIERTTSLNKSAVLSEYSSGNKSFQQIDADVGSPLHSFSAMAAMSDRKFSKKILKLHVQRLESRIDEANSNSESESEETKEDRFQMQKEQAQQQNLEVVRRPRGAIKRASFNSKEQ